MRYRCQTIARPQHSSIGQDRSLQVQTGKFDRCSPKCNVERPCGLISNAQPYDVGRCGANGQDCVSPLSIELRLQLDGSQAVSGQLHIAVRILMIMLCCLDQQHLRRRQNHMIAQCRVEKSFAPSSIQPEIVVLATRPNGGGHGA